MFSVLKYPTEFLTELLIEDMCVLQRNLESISNNRPPRNRGRQRKAGISVVAADEVNCTTETEKENIVGGEKRHRH